LLDDSLPQPRNRLATSHSFLDLFSKWLEVNLDSISINALFLRVWESLIFAHSLQTLLFQSLH